MIKYFIIIFFLASNFLSAQNKFEVSTSVFSVASGTIIRAIEVVNDSTVWFASGKGIWGYTENFGKTWNMDSIKIDSVQLEFRSIAVLNDSTVLLLSIASPAYLFRTVNKGKTWEVVYQNKDSAIFFDSMKFWDNQNGLAIGDPINGEIQMINTRDGGKTWKKVTHPTMPKLDNGEAFFASSNTCFDIFRNHTWMATGGKNSRVIYSPNGGRINLIQDPEMPLGKEMTGVYSIDFYNEKIGAVAGGNWDKIDTSVVPLSITENMGKVWKPIHTRFPVFGSCVQFRNEKELIITGNAGTFLYNIERDYWMEIIDKDSNKLKYQTFRFSPSKNVIWMAGGEGEITFIKLQ